MRLPLIPTIAAAALCLAPACNDEDPPLTEAELLDPAACVECHPDHVRQWSGSMHAYAAEDPVFLAMNARGQRETDGALGDFCVRCHAPLAVERGLTSDGLDLSDVPAHLRGVTCAYCHLVEASGGEHNNQLELAGDLAQRGGIRDPYPTTAHDSVYSLIHDREAAQSATFCGPCHDVVTPAGVHAERTYEEWRRSLFADEWGGRVLPCGGCHMPGRSGYAATEAGSPPRYVHDHTMPGVDLARTEFPEQEAQRAAVLERLRPAILTRVCVGPVLAGAEVVLDSFIPGHSFPSGAAHHRRAWVELVAWRDGQEVYRSGVVPDDEPVEGRAGDPDLWQLRDRLLGEDGRTVHMLWDARSYESELLPAPVTSDPADPAFDHSVRRHYVMPTLPDRVRARLRLRPIGLEVLDDLVAGGDLDPVYREVETWEVGPAAEWRYDPEAEEPYGCIPPE